LKDRPEAGCGGDVLKRTSAEEIRREIAARIIGGQLAPGTALDESQVAADFAVSRTPVREALRLLNASGLIEQRPHARATVAQPSEQKLRGMFEVMGELEALCAKGATVAMDHEERAALDDLHTQMASIVRAGDAVAYAEANDAFHSLIYEGAHNDYLAEITRATRIRVQPFRRAQFGALGRLGKSHAEHGLIVEAILRGDGSAAETAMRSHIAIVEDAYERLMRG
jgi:DNA-binding GntR family transcriptional regulator